MADQKGRFVARPDQRRAEKHLVMAPVLDEADIGAAVITLDRGRQDSDQPPGAADLDQARLAARGHGGQRGDDEPVLGEAVGLRRLVGERYPVLRKSAGNAVLMAVNLDVERVRRGHRFEPDRRARLPGPVASPSSQPDACAADSSQR